MHVHAQCFYVCGNVEKKAEEKEQNTGPVSTRDNRVLKGPLGRSLRSSLAPLTPLTRSAALRFAMLASLAHSVHGLAHSLHSLPRGTVEIHESVFMLKSHFNGNKRVCCRH